LRVARAFGLASRFFRSALPASIWLTAALVLAASIDLPLGPSPRSKARLVPHVEERAPPAQPKDKPVEFAPWEEVAT
jgi:hypothetical protein